MLLENPEIIQEARFAPPNTTPIFFFHDGGGTCFAYHCLESLARPVYGIHNPHFHSGRPWAGGIPEMAQVYLSMMRKTIDSPSFPGVSSLRYGERLKIMLGGWSLGGLLALQVAWLLDWDEEIEIVGIVMVDSIYPVLPSGWTKSAEARVDLGDAKTKTQVSVRRSMDLAGKMVREWTLPEWEWNTEDDAAVEPPLVILPQDGTLNEARTTGHPRNPPTAAPGPSGKRLLKGVPGGPPPTILLRAKNYVPVAGEGIGRVDVYREDQELGWGKYHPKFIARAMNLDGHHFDIFHTKHLDASSKAIKEACDLIAR